MKREENRVELQMEKKMWVVEICVECMAHTGQKKMYKEDMQMKYRSRRHAHTTTHLI